jgi:thiamine pyrophosphokinase
MRIGKAVIISNGKVERKAFYKNLIKSNDYIVAVNGGSKHARAFNVIPNVIIGDLDSISEEDYEFFLKKGCEFRKYPTNKDKTDVHLAVDYIIEKGFKEILLLCSFGDRIDHILANLFLLMKVAESGINVKSIDEFSETIYVNKSERIEGNVGEVVSLIPMTSIVTGVKLEGLKFEPKNGKLKMSDTLGISNILTKKIATISIKTGKLLVVKQNL